MEETWDAMLTPDAGVYTTSQGIALGAGLCLAGERGPNWFSWRVTPAMGTVRLINISVEDPIRLGDVSENELFVYGDNEAEDKGVAFLIYEINRYRRIEGAAPHFVEGALGEPAWKQVIGPMGDWATLSWSQADRTYTLTRDDVVHARVVIPSPMQTRESATLALVSTLVRLQKEATSRN